MHNNRKIRSCCSTSRSAADRQTIGPNKREVVPHVRTRSLDRSSPRVGRADNRGSSVNHTVQTDVKNLQDYLPRKLKKKTQTQVPESPLYSPETLNALENAEKLIKEAQKRILEASYDVHSSPERDTSARLAEMKTKDDETLYIRDVVASRFHEANESGRIFTRITARRPTERPSKPEVRQRWNRPIVGENSNFYGKERISRLGLMNNKKTTNPPDDSKKPQNISNLDKKSCKDENSQQVLRKETSKSDVSEKCINSNKQEDETVKKTFKVQKGPHVDIRNELTITSVEKIDISPCPPSFPVQHNIKTYEFRHNEPHVAERDIEPEISSKSPDKPEVEEKSFSITTKNPAAVSPNERGSSSDLVENKSGRSIELEPLEGHEDTRTLCRDVRNKEKLDKPAESFIDFLQRTENQQNAVTNDRNDNSSENLDAKNKIDIFDRAVKEFFHHLKRGNGARNTCESELDCPDGKLSIHHGVSEKFDVSEQSEISYELSEDGKYFADNWDLNEINLEAPNFGELDNVLRNFDGKMNQVFRATRNLGLLMSEYSNDENISDRSKINAIIKDSSVIGQQKLYPAKDIDFENKIVQENPTKDLPKNDHLNISVSTNENQDSESCREFSQAFCRLSQCENPSKESPLKEFLGKKILSHPRYSTPLNNDLKIAKTFDNNTNCTSNEFANFFNGIHRSKIERDKKLSRNEELSKIEKINDDKLVTTAEHEPISSVGGKNNLEVKKKIILKEIEKNCNFQYLFNRDRSIQNENIATHETVVLPTNETKEKQNFPTTSLIEKSISEKISKQDENSTGTKVIDEFLTKKNLSKSECSVANKIAESFQNQSLTKKNSSKSEYCVASKIAESSQNQSTRLKKTESARTSTLSGTKNSKQLESVRKSRNSANLPLASKSENVVQTTTVNRAIETSVKSYSGKEEKTSNISASIENKKSLAREEERKNKNSATSSSGSSIRDRTSFDISTAYSEDFEEPSRSSKKSNIHEKPNSPNDLPVKSLSNEPEVSTKAETNLNKDEEIKKSSHSSLPIQINSKTGITSLEKSISTSTKKLKEKNDEINLEAQTVEEKIVDENNIDKQSGNLSEIEENSGKGSDSSNSSVKSSKISRTSSLDGESHQNKMRTPEILDLKPNLFASPRSPCKGVIFSCDCKQCRLRIKARDIFEKSHNSTIETIFEEPFGEEKFVESRVEKMMEISYSKIAEKSTEPEEKYQNKSQNFSINSPNQEKGTLFMGIKSKLEEIVNFENSSFHHSTPKKFVEDSMCASEIFDSTCPDPIATVAYASRAIVTSEENYSEGELYLPSSCSYSLGEIRISEHGTCTTSGPGGAGSSRRNADTMRIFVSRSLINTDSTDNTTNAINSLGEVQETEVELTVSN